MRLHWKRQRGNPKTAKGGKLPYLTTCHKQQSILSEKSSNPIIFSLTHTHLTRVRTAIQSGTKCVLGTDIHMYTVEEWNGGARATPPPSRPNHFQLYPKAEGHTGWMRRGTAYVSKVYSNCRQRLPKIHSQQTHRCQRLESMFQSHGLHVRSSETGGRPAFTEDEAVHQLSHTLVKNKIPNGCSERGGT